MPFYMQCEVCLQTSTRLVQHGFRSVCVDCVAMNQYMPYDRLHYIEDEDLLSRDDDDTDRDQSYYDKED